MPALAALTPLGRRMLARYPPFVRDVPEFIAINHACARLLEEVAGLVEQVRRQSSPRLADIMLREWEAVFGAPIEPAGTSVEQRQLAAVAYARRLRGVPYGLTWLDKIALLVGPGFTPSEHDPHNPATPAANVVRVTIPFAPGSGRYVQLLSVLREITPAHLDIQLVYDADAFLLDFSLLDLQEL